MNAHNNVAFCHQGATAFVFSLHDELEIPINNCQSIFDTEFLGVISFQKLITINSKIELVLKPFSKLQ